MHTLIHTGTAHTRPTPAHTPRTNTHIHAHTCSQMHTHACTQARTHVHTHWDVRFSTTETPGPPGNKSHVPTREKDALPTGAPDSPLSPSSPGDQAHGFSQEPRRAAHELLSVWRNQHPRVASTPPALATTRTASLGPSGRPTSVQDPTAQAARAGRLTPVRRTAGGRSPPCTCRFWQRSWHPPSLQSSGTWSAPPGWTPGPPPDPTWWGRAFWTEPRGPRACFCGDLSFLTVCNDLHLSLTPDKE